MFDDPKGPIEHLSWGQFIIAGQEHAHNEDTVVGCGKDIRLIGNQVSAWKERKGHKLKPEMITGVYQSHVDTLILGIGVDGMIKVPKETIKAVKEHGIKNLLIEKTPQACRLYNELFHKGEHVALLAHGTC
jgi:hypothetical protein